MLVTGDFTIGDVVVTNYWVAGILATVRTTEGPNTSRFDNALALLPRKARKAPESLHRTQRFQVDRITENDNGSANNVMAPGSQ